MKSPAPSSRKPRRHYVITPTSEGGSPEEFIFAAAAKLFAQRGFHGVTVRQIADEAGVHFSLIRYHYGDKENLYRTCVQRYGEARLHAAQQFLSPPKSREDFELKLRYAVEDVFRAQLANLDLTRIVLREVESEEPLADDILGSTLVEMAKHFTAFFVAAKNFGYVREDAHPLFLAHALQGIINHFVRTDPVRKRHFGMSLADDGTRRMLIDQVHAFVLHGVSREPLRRQP